MTHPEGTAPVRTGKDKAIIAALVVLLVALLGGVAWGVTYVVGAVTSEARGVQEMAARPVPATPDELRAAAAASGSAEDKEPTSLASLFAPTIALADEAPAEEAAATDAASDAAASADAAAQEQGAQADASEGTVRAGAGSSGADKSASSDANLVDNPIDFKALKAEYPDIYAWLYIPNTGINLPLLQDPFDDFYYLTHNATGEEDVYGAVFSQIANKTDFSDPVTVFYGHDGEAQLKNLHYFEDEQFFADNDVMYVYTTGHIYTYRVIAAYKYDNRHILNSFDFTDEQQLQDYFNSVLNPDSLSYNVREGATLDAKKDKIIQLSTCMLDEFHGSSRYIVTGVLVDDQPTR